MVGVEGVGDFDGERKQGLIIERTACDAMLQCHAIEILHDDEWPAVFLPDFVDCANIGMIQGRGSLRFTLESSQSLGIARNIIGQELDRKSTRLNSSHT